MALVAGLISGGISAGMEAGIPDFIDLDQGIIAESKNVASLSYTKQLHDYVDKATEMGTKLELFVRQNTKLSKTLQDAIDKGLINLNYFSW